MNRQKSKGMFFVILCSFLLCGCEQNGKTDGTSVKIEEDGTVIHTIIEEFDETLYNEDALKNMVLAEASAFNSTAGAGSMTVDKLEAEDGKVTVKMTFEEASMYADFNGKTFFYGTVSQAYDAGMNMDVTLSSTKEDEESIGKEEILKLGEAKLLVIEEPIEVFVPSKILYASENVAVISGKSAKVLDDGKIAYLILK